jgi:hypothetical protein
MKNSMEDNEIISLSPELLIDLRVKKLPILFWINKKDVNTAPPIRNKEIPVVDNSNEGTMTNESKNIVIAKNEE